MTCDPLPAPKWEAPARWRAPGYTPPKEGKGRGERERRTKRKRNICINAISFILIK